MTGILPFYSKTAERFHWSNRVAAEKRGAGKMIVPFQVADGMSFATLGHCKIAHISPLEFKGDLFPVWQSMCLGLGSSFLYMGVMTESGSIFLHTCD